MDHDDDYIAVFFFLGVVALLVIIGRAINNNAYERGVIDHATGKVQCVKVLALAMMDAVRGLEAV